ncbi:MAG: hypothetical protein WCJ03_09315 [Bacteroidales bacterium]
MAIIGMTNCLPQNGDGNDYQIDVNFTNINDFDFATSILSSIGSCHALQIPAKE